MTLRISELRFRLAELLPDPDTYCNDFVLAELGGVTINQALAMGCECEDIWKAFLAHNPQFK
jgi:hypothetical protein